MRGTISRSGSPMYKSHVESKIVKGNADYPWLYDTYKVMANSTAAPLSPAVKLVLPASAQAHYAQPVVCVRAPCYQPVVRHSAADHQTYKGWGFITANYCPPGMACAAIYHSSTTAWRWTGSSWSKTSIADRTQVYIHPYASGWSWVWTSRTGWLAVQSGSAGFNAYAGARV